MDFDWDARKATTNRKKHGVSFEEASTAFRDPLSRTAADQIIRKARTAGLRSVYRTKGASSS